MVPENIDAIVHLAALSRDPDCRGKAFDCFDSNVMSTLRLMDIAQEKGKNNLFFLLVNGYILTIQTVRMLLKTLLLTLPNTSLNMPCRSWLQKRIYVSDILQGYIPVTILRFGIVYGPRPSNWCAVEGLLNQVRTKEEITVGSKQTTRILYSCR